MGKIIDLTGQKFGLLTVKAFAHGGNNAHWTCECECGNITVVTALNLKTGNTTKCNDPAHREGQFLVDITGQKFGRLTVIALHSSAGRNSERTNWFCLMSEVIHRWNLHHSKTVRNSFCTLRKRPYFSGRSFIWQNCRL